MFDEIPKLKIVALRRFQVAEAIKGDVDSLLKGIGDQSIAKEIKHVLEMVFYHFVLSLLNFDSLCLVFTSIWFSQWWIVL